MITLNYNQAHQFVSDQRRLGNDVRWDGWDIVLWKPTHYGFSATNGAFRNKRWGVESRVRVSNDGLWRVSKRNVKSS